MKFDWEFFNVYISLMKALMGAGLLAYPFYIKEYGMISLIFLSTVACFFSSCGLIFYAICNKKIGKNSSMSSIAAHIIPRLQPIVALSISLKCFWVSVLYLKILEELMASQVKYAVTYFPSISSFSNRLVMLLFILTSPLSFIDNITKLKFTSFLGIAAIIVVLISNTYSFFTAETKTEIHWTGSKKIYFTKLGDIVYGFTCHQNIFSVQNEMKNKSIAFLAKIVAATMASSLVIYLYFGFINYKIFGNAVGQTILTNYGASGDSKSFVVISLFSFMLLLSIPLQIHPCRMYILGVFDESLNRSRRAKFITTSLILVGVYALGNWEMVDIRKIYTYIGGTVSSFICFVFGGIYFLKLGRGECGFMKAMAILTLMFGFYAFSGFVFNTFSEVLEVIKGKSK